MLTIFFISLIILGSAWCALCAVPELLPLSPMLYFLGTGVFFAFALALSLVSIFGPDTPRLPREEGRLKEGGSAVMLLCIGIGFLLLIWDADAYFNGKELICGLPATTAMCASVLIGAGMIFVTGGNQSVLCWNDEGVQLRSWFGRIHRWVWADLTGFQLHRGSLLVLVGKRHFTVPSEKFKMDMRFIQAANHHRAREKLPPIHTAG